MRRTAALLERQEGRSLGLSLPLPRDLLIDESWSLLREGDVLLVSSNHLIWSDLRGHRLWDSQPDFHVNKIDGRLLLQISSPPIKGSPCPSLFNRPGKYRRRTFALGRLSRKDSEEIRSLCRSPPAWCWGPSFSCSATTALYIFPMS